MCCTKKEMSWSYKPWWHILATNCVEPINMTKRRKRSLSTEWIKLLESFPIKQRFRDSPCFLFENLIFWSFLWYILRKINCLFIYCWCYKTTVTSRTIFLLAPGSNVSEEDDYNLNIMLTKLCCWIRRALYFRHTQILYAQIGCQFISIVLLIFHPSAILYMYLYISIHVSITFSDKSKTTQPWKCLMQINMRRTSFYVIGFFHLGECRQCENSGRQFLFSYSWFYWNQRWQQCWYEGWIWPYHV